MNMNKMLILYKADLVILIIESINFFTNGRTFKLKSWLDKPF